MAAFEAGVGSDLEEEEPVVALTEEEKGASVPRPAVRCSRVRGLPLVPWWGGAVWCCACVAGAAPWPPKPAACARGRDPQP